nr:MAG TPA: hypothetical protein [Caudoviricetes sp.]
MEVNVYKNPTCFSRWSVRNSFHKYMPPKIYFLSFSMVGTVVGQ